MSVVASRRVGKLLFACVVVAAWLPTDAGSQAVTWILAPDHRFKSPGGVSLSDALHIAEGPDGHLYFTKPREGFVRVLDAQGQERPTAGRVRTGPGEVHFIRRFGWIRDSLWTIDLATRRISFFGSKPVSTREFEFPTVSLRRMGLAFEPAAVLADGSVLVREMWSARDEALASATGLLLLRLGRTGKVIDTLRWLSARNVAFVLRLSTGGLLQYTQPWSDDDMYAIDSQGKQFVLVQRRVPEDLRAAIVQIDGHRFDGGRGFALELPYEPVALGADRFVSEVRKITQYVFVPGRFATETDASVAIGSKLFRPPFLPPVRKVLIGPDQSVWINVVVDGDERTWHVYDANGALVAKLVAPRGIELVVASMTDVWATQIRNGEAQGVQRFRIVK